MPKVILVDNPRAEFDVSGLAEFGEVVNVRDQMVSPFKAGTFEESLIRALMSWEFDPDEDYIALVGRQMQLVLSVITIQKVCGRVRLLVHSTVESRYVVREVECQTMSKS